MANYPIPTYSHGIMAQHMLQRTNFAPFERHVSSVTERRKRNIETVKGQGTYAHLRQDQGHKT